MCKIDKENGRLIQKITLSAGQNNKEYSPLKTEILRTKIATFVFAALAIIAISAFVVLINRHGPLQLCLPNAQHRITDFVIKYGSGFCMLGAFLSTGLLLKNFFNWQEKKSLNNLYEDAQRIIDAGK